MSHPKPVFRDGNVAQDGEAKPLSVGEQITAEHLNGQRQSVTFDTISGDKFDQVRIRWPMAGFYDVNIETGALLGGGRKGRKAASVWRIIPDDMARIRATRSKFRDERRERMRKNKGGRR